VRGTWSRPIRLGLIYFHGARPGGHSPNGIRKWGPLWLLGVCLYEPLRGAHRGGLLRWVRWGHLDWFGGSRSTDRRAHMVWVHSGGAERGGITSTRHPGRRLLPTVGPEPCAASIGSAIVLVWVRVVACRTGRGRKWPARGGPGSGGEAWSPMWGRTAERPASCLNSLACCPGSRCPCACGPP